jgi:hypothetical protein
MFIQIIIFITLEIAITMATISIMGLAIHSHIQAMLWLDKVLYIQKVISIIRREVLGLVQA